MRALSNACIIIYLFFPIQLDNLMIRKISCSLFSNFQSSLFSGFIHFISICMVFVQYIRFFSVSYIFVALREYMLKS